MAEFQFWQKEVFYSEQFFLRKYNINNGSTGTGCEICSNSTVKTPEWCHWPRSSVFIVNFEQICSLHYDFGQVNAGWKWIGNLLVPQSASLL